MLEAIPPVDRILAAAEVVLRRHGVEKTNVVDVARALGISHTSIYRHFPSKKALLDAVAAHWLNVVTSPLKVIAKDLHPIVATLGMVRRAVPHPGKRTGGQRCLEQFHTGERIPPSAGG